MMTKPYNFKRCILLLQLFVAFTAFTQSDSITTKTANDSIRVYIMVRKFERGGSTYKFVTRNKIVTNKFNNNHWMISFYVPIDSNLKDGDPISLGIAKKRRFINSYKPIYMTIQYSTDKKYFILYSNRKLKRKYRFSELWTNSPEKYFIHIGKLFYLDTEIYPKPPDKITYEKIDF